MAGDRVICRCRNVSYLDIRKAMKGGARTLDEIMDHWRCNLLWGMYKPSSSNFRFCMWL